jgi:hypothetical protein
VVVEEHVQRWNVQRWEISKYFAANDHEHALFLARQTAEQHVPFHPKQPKSRTLLRLPDGSWMVHMMGTTTQWHFRVSVAEHYGTVG